MRIKSYFAGTVEEAMEKARRELGPEAMLMNSKKTEVELRALGAYEVVFAVPPEAARENMPILAKVPAKAPAAPAERADSAMPNELARELAELRKQIETVKRSVNRRPAAGDARERSEENPDTVVRLTAADFSEDTAVELAAAIDKRRQRDGVSVESALRAECAERLRFAPSFKSPATAPRIVVFVGAAGAGKTTSLMKLALRYGVQGRLPLHLLSLDTLRIGGWEHLASYARIAGIPCQPIHTPAALQQALNEHASNKLVLIDTPGLSPADGTQIARMAAGFAAYREQLEVNLVLSATALPRVQLATIERFAPFAPAKLLFTRLDEMESQGPLVETALRSGMVLSFLGCGQQVPEDIEEASLDRVLGPLMEGAMHPQRIASAA